ncbi:transcription factor CP2-like isoform X2 [Halichoerus grypus]
MGSAFSTLLEPGFYQEIFLDELSAVELMGKLAELLALPANQIHHLFHQGPGGVLILLSDQVVQNLKDESYFVAVVKKGPGTSRCKNGRLMPAWFSGAPRSPEALLKSSAASSGSG